MERVFRFIEELKLLKAGDKVLLGVSGGADSTCLFCIMTALAKKMPLQVAVVHVHHGIRGEEAEGDAAFVRELCEREQIPFFLERADVPALAKEWGLSEEAAGRRVRYEAFRRRKEEWGADVIAVAHQKEDSAETVLLNLFRGSSLAGLRGLQPRNGDVIRPLLCLQRREVLEILQRLGQPWREDCTNEEDGYTRNRIRHRILSYAQESVNAQAVEHILNAARRIGEANDHLNREADERFDELCEPRQSGFFLKEDVWEKTEPALRGILCRKVMSRVRGSGIDLEMVHITALKGLFEKRPGKKLDLPGGLRAYRMESGILLEKAEPKSVEGGKAETEKKTELPHYTFVVKERNEYEKIPDSSCTKCFDYDKISKSVLFRFFLQGDYITIAPAGKKSVKKYMIDQKIPRELRDQIWLLADGSHILWIVGYRVSEYYKVNEQTKNILEASI